MNNGHNLIPANAGVRILSTVIDLFIIFLIVVFLNTLVAYLSLPIRIITVDKVLVVYYWITLSIPNWQTTLGGKIFKIIVVQKNDLPISLSNKLFIIGFYYILLNFGGIWLIFSNESIFLDNSPHMTLSASLITASIIIITMVIVNLPIFFIKNKLSFIDWISRTRAVKKQ